MKCLTELNDNGCIGIVLAWIKTIDIIYFRHVNLYSKLIEDFTKKCFSGEYSMWKKGFPETKMLVYLMCHKWLMGVKKLKGKMGAKWAPKVLAIFTVTSLDFKMASTFIHLLYTINYQWYASIIIKCSKFGEWAHGNWELISITKFDIISTNSIWSPFWIENGPIFIHFYICYIKWIVGVLIKMQNRANEYMGYVK